MQTPLREFLRTALAKTIALILAFVGLKILLAELVPIGDVASLAVIAGLLTGGALASSLADRLDPPEPDEADARRPPRCPPELVGEMRPPDRVAQARLSRSMPVCSHLDQIRVTALPASIAGCEECLRIGSKWLHLRMCLTCGKIGCCDSSPNRHASRHAAEAGHPIARSAEPGEEWSWCYVDEVGFVVETPDVVERGGFP